MKIALVSAVFTASLAMPSSSVHASYSAALSRCATSQLGLYAGQSDGGMGHVGIQFRFQNRSKIACTLYGYPGAQLLNSKGQPVTTHLTWGMGYLSGNLRKVLVRLNPGGSAYFILEWSHVSAGNKPCPTYPSVRVTPPNTRTSIKSTPKYGIDACGGGLTASPVQPKSLIG